MFALAASVVACSTESTSTEEVTVDTTIVVMDTTAVSDTIVE